MPSIMPTSVELKVEKSVIKFGGSARVNTTVINELGIKDGELAVIRSDNQDILVNLFSDSLIEEDCIKLREADMNNLSITSGAMVEVMAHQSLLKKGLTDKFL